MNKERNIILEVIDLKKYFPITDGVFRHHVGDVRAVDGVNFFINYGETLGVVGESGCGKTTTGRLIMKGIEPTNGKILFHRKNETIDVTTLREEELTEYRKEAQMIFQDPFSSLDSRMTVLRIIEEPLLYLTDKNKNERRERVRMLLDIVGLSAHHANRYPHAFSGGQRQRIGIARALAINPKLIIADEAVSALDVSIQAQVINLMEELQREFSLTYLFIAHDLTVVKHISDRVAVMYAGKIVELAESDSIFSKPLHPYTEALLSAVPRSDPDKIRKKIPLKGEVPDLSEKIVGCCFYPRCNYAEEKCKHREPEFRNKGNEKIHLVACHRADELELDGVYSAEELRHSIS